MVVMGATDMVVIVETKATYYGSDGWRVCFRVKNQGNRSANDSYGKVSTKSGTVKYGYFYVPKLAAGATSGTYCDYVKPGGKVVMIPRLEALVQADIWNLVAESNEGNNWASFK